MMTASFEELLYKGYKLLLLTLHTEQNTCVTLSSAMPEIRTPTSQSKRDYCRLTNRCLYFRENLNHSVTKSPLSVYLSVNKLCK